MKPANGNIQLVSRRREGRSGDFLIKSRAEFENPLYPPLRENYKIRSIKYARASSQHCVTHDMNDALLIHHVGHCDDVLIIVTLAWKRICMIIIMEYSTYVAVQWLLKARTVEVDYPQSGTLTRIGARVG